MRSVGAARPVREACPGRARTAPARERGRRGGHRSSAGHSRAAGVPSPGCGRFTAVGCGPVRGPGVWSQGAPQWRPGCGAGAGGGLVCASARARGSAKMPAMRRARGTGSERGCVHWLPERGWARPGKASGSCVNWSSHQRFYLDVRQTLRHGCEGEAGRLRPRPVPASRAARPQAQGFRDSFPLPAVEGHGRVGAWQQTRRASR